MPDSLDWVDPDGTVYPLDGSWGITAAWGSKGRHGTGYKFLEQSLPQQHGSQVTGVWADPSEITLPWESKFSSELEFRTWLDDATWAFSPRRGLGALRSTRADGTVRDFPCRMRQGFDQLQESLENGFAFNAPRDIFVFRGGPFWQAQTPVTITLDTDSGPGLFFPVAFPWYLSDSTVFAKPTVVNPGHVEAWPLIYVRGPGNGFEYRDLLTGDNFGVNVVIPAGDAITIDSRQAGNRRVYLESTKQDLMAQTTGDMFAFQPRRQIQLQVSLAGADANSLVQIEFFPNYENP